VPEQFTSLPLIFSLESETHSLRYRVSLNTGRAQSLYRTTLKNVPCLPAGLLYPSLNASPEQVKIYRQTARYCRSETMS